MSGGSAPGAVPVPRSVGRAARLHLVGDQDGFITASGIDPERLAVAVARDTSDHWVLIATDGTIVACNRPLLATSGCGADELLGRSVFDVIDPRDLERSAQILPLASESGAPGGVSSFGIVRADGEVVTASVAADTIDLDGERYILFRGRPVWFPQAIDQLLDGLLEGAPLRHLFAQVPECLAWREDGSRVAITWTQAGELVGVDTGLDRRLTGIDPDAEPWATLRRTGGSAVGAIDDLPAPVARVADGLGLSTFWIVVVDGPGESSPVLITVFGSHVDFPVRALHPAGMDMARRYIRLILQWIDQKDRLEVAAHADPLTGLSNRRHFLDLLESSDRGGAVLYCDLDGFKPVNDRWGHAAGDEVLVEVGRRLQDLVRTEDLVARVGGDEFAVVLWEAGDAEAEHTAQRIRAACAQPIEVAAGAVTIGISVGVATGADRLHAEVVASADAALYEEKAQRRRPRADDR